MGGTNDVVGGRCSDPITSVATDRAIANLQVIYNEAKASGMKVIALTIPPAAGLTNYGIYHCHPSETQQNIDNLNAFVRSSPVDAVIDAYQLLGDPARPTFLNPTLSRRDGLHPNDAGAALLAQTISAQGFGGAAPSGAPVSVPEKPIITPKLSINIPTVNFSQAAQQGNILFLPFLADYITGLYKYLLAIVGILAGVMLTVGGVKYLISGGSQERVTSAKNTIGNALIGLIIAFGSYVILFTINPELVKFRALQIEQTRPILLNFIMDEGNGSLTSGEPTSSPDTTPPTELQALANRVAEQIGINACLFRKQIAMESSGWNVALGAGRQTGCCYGLGGVHFVYTAKLLNNLSTRRLVAEIHSRGESALPPLGSSDRTTISNWLTSDPEGNLIVAAIFKKNASSVGANPIASAAIYGMGPPAYRSYLQATGCRPQRFNETQLFESLNSGASIDTLVQQSCIPPTTWPLTGEHQKCPGSNKCCREGTDCQQPNMAPGGRGRLGVCVGGSRNGQPCFAVAGAEQYSRTYLFSVRSCARESQQ